MNLKRKLKSERGETLIEVLVAVLISALALMMFAGMISTSMRLTTESKNKLEDYYKTNASLEQKVSGGNNTSISMDGLAPVTNITYLQTKINKIINDRVNAEEMIKYTERTEEGTKLVVTESKEKPYNLIVSGQIQPVKCTIAIHVEATIRL